VAASFDLGDSFPVFTTTVSVGVDFVGSLPVATTAVAVPADVGESLLFSSVESLFSGTDIFSVTGTISSSAFCCSFCLADSSSISFSAFLSSILDATWGRFHQHFKRAFLVQKCFAQLSLDTFQLCNFGCKKRM